MRDPASSCSSCGSVVQGAGILYTTGGAAVCEPCLRQREWAAGHLNATTTGQLAHWRAAARRAAARKRSWLLVATALAWLGGAGIAASQLRHVSLVGTIDVPGPRATAELRWVTVGGRWLAGTEAFGRETLWLLVQPLVLAADTDACWEARQVNPAVEGRWSGEVDLEATLRRRWRTGDRFRIHLVAASREAHDVFVTWNRISGERCPQGALLVPPAGVRWLDAVDVVAEVKLRRCSLVEIFLDRQDCAADEHLGYHRWP